MPKPPQRRYRLRRRKHGGRLVFTLLVIASIIVLAVAIRAFLISASMTLGGVIGTPSSGVLSTMIVNQRRYEPPRDSLITPTQVAFLLRVVDLDDSLRRNDAPTAVFRSLMAAHFNRHVMTLSEYGWVAQHAQASLVAAREYGLIDFASIPQGLRRRFDRFLPATSLSTSDRDHVRIEADRMRIAAPLLVRRLHGDSLLFPDLGAEPYGLRKSITSSAPRS